MINFDAITHFFSTRGTELSLKVLGAIALWVLGRWVIKLVMRLFRAFLKRNQTVDATLINYLVSIVSVLLTVLLILGVLDLVGIQTASFAALLAGAGLAIGTAWGGLLTHFAAGAFMQVLRPFQVGDIVTAGGITGLVKEVGLFGTTIITADNVKTIIGNNKVFSEVIQNYSAMPTRRVDCTCKIANGVDANAAIALLRTAVAAIPNVVTNPAPEVGILSFAADGTVLCVRPSAPIDHFGQVFFDTNQAIADTFVKAGYPAPELAHVQRSV